MLRNSLRCRGQGVLIFMCLKCKWGEWTEKTLNHYPYVIPKKEYRRCPKCGNEQERDLPSLEKRLFNYHKEGSDIESVAKKLMNDYGIMRYEYITRTLIKDLIDSRK
jgi:hypothetical protein